MDAKSQTIGKVMKADAEAKYDGVITLHLIGRFLEKIIEGSYRCVQTQGNFIFIDFVSVYFYVNGVTDQKSYGQTQGNMKLSSKIAKGS